MSVYPADYPVLVPVGVPVRVPVHVGLLLPPGPGRGPQAKADPAVDDVVYHGLRPIWFAMQAAGFYPMHRLCRGARPRELSLWLAVTVLQYAVVLAATVTSCTAVAAASRKQDFDGIIIEYLVYIQCALPVAVLPLYALQRKRVAEYLHDWRCLQTEFAGESGRALSALRGFSARAALEALAVVGLWLAAAVGALLPLQSPLVVAALAHSMLVSALLAAWWYLHGRLLRAAARGLADHLAKVLSRPAPRPDSVDACRLLVLRLASLAGGLGSAVALPLGVLLLLHFVLETLTLYALFGQLAYTTRNAARLPLLVVGGAFSGGVLYLCCDTGHRVASAVKTDAMHEILQFRKRTAFIGQDLSRMIETFIATIQEVPSDVTLSGIATVNRSLFTAILSTMVTYLVVVVQFRVSLEAQEEEVAAVGGRATTAESLADASSSPFPSTTPPATVTAAFSSSGMAATVERTP